MIIAVRFTRIFRDNVNIHIFRKPMRNTYFDENKNFKSTVIWEATKSITNSFILRLLNITFLLKLEK